MRQQTNLAKAKNLRHFFITFFFLISFNQAFASGARRPNLSSSNLGSTNTGSSTSIGSTKNSKSTKSTKPATTAAPASTPITTAPTITVSGYSHLDPNHEVPAGLLKTAIDYFDSHKSIIKNKSTLGVIDFSQHNSKERFYLIDMVSGAVDRYLVAHGKNSDPNYTGYATIFSNTPGSEMSSQGFYLTAETYIGGHGLSLALDGLSPTNSNARSRAIVIHPADYVQPGDKIGRSWGCPALDPRYSQEVIDRIKGGVLIYAQ